MLRLFRYWIIGSFIALCSAWLMIELLNEYPYFELLNHWRVSFSLLYGIYLILLMMVRCRLGALLALGMLSWTSYPWIYLGYFSAAPRAQPASGMHLSLLQWNVYYKNQKIEPFIESVQQHALPDILLIQEVTPRILQALTPLIKQYPYRLEAPQMDSYGMALFSKFPFIRCQRFTFACSTNHYSLIEFTISPDQLPILLVESHIRSPARKRNLSDRSAELQELASIIVQQPHRHKIVVGDLNTTPYSPYLKQFLARTQLQNTMQGIRFQGTWSPRLPPWLRLPIDHLLISDSIQLIAQQLYPFYGSDHRPIASQLNINHRTF